MNKLFLAALLALTITQSYGQETPVDCSEDESELVINEKTETKFCFDPKATQNNKELVEDFEMLNLIGLFDKDHCLIEKNRKPDNEALVTRFLQKNLEGKVQVFAVTHPEMAQVNLLYTNSENAKFIKNALSAQDKWQIAGYSAASIAVGALVSEKVYEGQADKRKHWMVGATLSGLTTGTTYLLLEKTGLGNRLNLSAKAKKNIIMFSGPIMGTVLGIMKEVYDTKHKNKHTPDIHDAAATSLGAGIGIFAIKLAF
jgi:hypothetical protein